MVLRLAFTYTGNRSDAQDISQEVFIKLLRSTPTFRDSEHEKAWILRVTINRCKDLLRSLKRRRSVPLEQVSPSLGGTEEREVVEAVLELPQKYRVVIHLYYFEEYSTAEMASLLSVKESTIRSQLMRARALLKKRLEGSEDE